MLEGSKNVYMVYFHVNMNSHEVFYVGIGKNNRPYDVYGRSLVWKEYVKSNKYEVIIIHTDLSITEAMDKEIAYISQIGRKDQNKGVLVNLTDGGQGVTAANRRDGVIRNFQEKVIKYNMIKAIESSFVHTPRKIGHNRQTINW